MRVVVLAVWGVISAAAVYGQTPAPSRSGGLLPRQPTAATTPLRTREELMRQWDLNADGQIDEGEAEVARSKMRRERIEMRQKMANREAQAATAPAAEPSEAAEELAFPEPPPRPVKKEPAPEVKKAPMSAAREPAPPPKKDLNAGRLPAGLPAAQGLPPGGLPAGRVGTGSLTPDTGGPTKRPLMAPRLPAPRASRPPTFPTRPRVSAEEIGGP